MIPAVVAADDGALHARDIPGHAQAKRQRVGAEVVRDAWHRAAVVLEPHARLERHAIVHSPAVLREPHRAPSRRLGVVAGPVFVHDDDAVLRVQRPPRRPAHCGLDRCALDLDAGAQIVPPPAAAGVMADRRGSGDRRPKLVAPERVAALNARGEVLTRRRAFACGGRVRFVGDRAGKPLVRSSATVLPDAAHVARAFHARVRVNTSGELSGVGLYWDRRSPNTSEASRVMNP